VKTRVSTKGQVVLPQAIREKLDLRPGDQMDTRIDGNRIVLIPSRTRSRKGRIVKDPLTGFPVLSAGKNAPRLKSKQVAEILSEFP
jgi:AbrB family looped-hinge helix DNA binding protein